MGRPKGYPDPRKDPEALRYTGWRPPLVAGEFEGLVDAIAKSRGLSKRAIIEAALLAYAMAEEIEAAGLGGMIGAVVEAEDADGD